MEMLGPLPPLRKCYSHRIRGSLEDGQCPEAILPQARVLSTGWVQYLLPLLGMVVLQYLDQVKARQRHNTPNKPKERWRGKWWQWADIP